jgi:aminopeptidase
MTIIGYNYGMQFNQKEINDYAKVIVRVGVNVQKNQPVVISAIVEALPLVQAVVEQCYKAGASKVMVQFDDGKISRLHYLNQSLKTLTTIPKYEIDYLSNPILTEGACRISIRGSSPNLLKGIDKQKVQSFQKARSTALKPLSD